MPRKGKKNKSEYGLRLAEKQKLRITYGLRERQFKSYFRDAASGFLNNGPLPLRVGKTTNFTIHWVITNYATDMGDVRLRATLGPNVTVTSNISSTISAKPIYNERTQEMSWL